MYIVRVDISESDRANAFWGWAPIGWYEHTHAPLLLQKHEYYCCTKYYVVIFHEGSWCVCQAIFKSTREACAISGRSREPPLAKERISIFYIFRGQMLYKFSQAVFPIYMLISGDRPLQTKHSYFRNALLSYAWSVRGPALLNFWPPADSLRSAVRGPYAGQPINQSKCSKYQTIGGTVRLFVS